MIITSLDNNQQTPILITHGLYWKTQHILENPCLSSIHGATTHPTALMLCPKYDGQTPGDFLSPNRYYASKIFKFQATLL